MTAFRIGDVCVVISSPTNPSHVGMECTVTSGLKWYRSSDTGEVLLAHKVESPHFEPIIDPECEWFAEPATLRLRRPPSWDKWLYNTDDVVREHERAGEEHV